MAALGSEVVTSSSESRKRAESIMAQPEPRPRHIFGGIEFEETGEVRAYRNGEWVLSSAGYVLLAEDDYHGTRPSYHILRPVRILDTTPKEQQP